MGHKHRFIATSNPKLNQCKTKSCGELRPVIGAIFPYGYHYCIPSLPGKCFYNKDDVRQDDCVFCHLPKERK